MRTITTKKWERKGGTMGRENREKEEEGEI
jgi:hypothetical protein